MTMTMTMVIMMKIQIEKRQTMCGNNFRMGCSVIVDL